MFIFPFAVIQQICTPNMNSCPFPLRENIIQNTCDFNFLQINKKNIICNDYGKYYKFCNTYLIPENFILYKISNNINNINDINDIDDILIYPKNILLHNSKKIITNFYYIFKCDKKYNNPMLIVNVVPSFNYNKSYNQIIYETIIIILIFGFLIISNLLILYIYLFKNKNIVSLL